MNLNFPDQILTYLFSTVIVSFKGDFSLKESPIPDRLTSRMMWSLSFTGVVSSFDKLATAKCALWLRYELMIHCVHCAKLKRLLGEWYKDKRDTALYHSLSSIVILFYLYK